MPQKINKAAIGLFQQFGESFTLDQLSEKAQTSRATLYRRIGSKEALLKNLNSQGLIQFDEQTSIKNRIMLATRKVVAKHGFINCTMEQIATEADLGIATLYRHFAEKEKLLLAFTSHLKSNLPFDEFSKIAHLSLEDGMLIMLKTMLKTIHKNSDMIQILFFSNPDERKYINTIRDGSKSTFSNIIKHLQHYKSQGKLPKNANLEDLVTSLLGQVMQFAIISPQHFNRPLNVDQDAKTIANLFCHGVFKSENGGK